ncbi:hypothetical protein KJ855_00560 [Patescibacteria group bacterium]|nr:hypothetical protein [Patescibacteria group bacterium]
MNSGSEDNPIEKKNFGTKPEERSESIELNNDLEEAAKPSDYLKYRIERSKRADSARYPKSLEKISDFQFVNKPAPRSEGGSGKPDVHRYENHEAFEKKTDDYPLFGRVLRFAKNAGNFLKGLIRPNKKEFNPHNALNTVNLELKKRSDKDKELPQNVREWNTDRRR